MEQFVYFIYYKVCYSIYTVLYQRRIAFPKCIKMNECRRDRKYYSSGKLTDGPEHEPVSIVRTVVGQEEPGRLGLGMQFLVRVKVPVSVEQLTLQPPQLVQTPHKQPGLVH